MRTGPADAAASVGSLTPDAMGVRSMGLRWRWSWLALAGAVLVLLGSFFMGLNFRRASPEAYAVGIPGVLIGALVLHVRRRSGGWGPAPSVFAVLGALIVAAAGYVAGFLAEVTNFTGMVVAPVALVVGLLVAQMHRETDAMAAAPPARRAS